MTCFTLRNSSQRLIERRVFSKWASVCSEVSPYTCDSDWELSPKQDHLVCFLGGSLLLGVTDGRGPFPPRWSTLSNAQRRDWNTGTELIKTCMATHNTATYVSIWIEGLLFLTTCLFFRGLSPEIAHFKTADKSDGKTPDW